jgi:diguanylate cyclase (GGDEF)-like protein
VDATAQRLTHSGSGNAKVLIVDDSPIDAELSLMELRRAGMVMDSRIAVDEAALRAALRTFIPDVILCDFGFPDFDGFAAQRIVREVHPHTPLIFVSGTISEDRAVLALQSGAVDYVLKGNLLRLPSAVQRAVRDSQERQRLERSLESSEAQSLRQAKRLEALWRIVNNPALRGEELMLAMLQQGSAAIRPDQTFRGLLGRIEGNEIVVIGVGVDPADENPRAARVSIGTRYSLDKTLLGQVDRTRGWDDLATMTALPEHPAVLGWGSLISTLFDAGGERFALTFASPVPTTTRFSNEDVAYLEVLASSFASQLQVNRLEASLRDAEERARQHAERLEALWRLVNDRTIEDDDLWLAMLHQGAGSIRPGQLFRGRLCRIDGTDLILEAFTDRPGRSLAYPDRLGSGTPLAATIVATHLAAGGGTRSLDDIQSGPFATERTRMHRTQSLLITTFNAGGTIWSLSFSSDEPSHTPFGPQDRAYIDVLASFFANNVQQRWQFNRIQYQQSHDVLTGLLNRSQFRSQARASSNVCSRFAVVLVDVNAFREINESYGHMIGDAVLVEIGNALQHRATSTEFVARVGGDVFGVYIPDPPSLEFIRSRALDFAEVFARGFSTGDRDGKGFIARTASLGIAVAPADGPKIDTILSHADAALSTAKERGHGSLVFYEAGMEGEAQRRAAFRNELSEAIAADQFTLYYQPHIEISTGRVTGCEALIRWNHPERGLLLPSHFIPFAEQTGIITSIDSWVMRNSFAAANDLGAARPGFRLFFNLSGRQASDPKLIRAFVRAARDGVTLANVGVEITESDAMRDVEATRRVCRALRKLNVQIAIDDFGTGYSSLSFLKRLPVDIVKIDRSFISGLLSDPHDETIAETIISITERFGFESLAEGVEQPAEIDWLRARACRYVQGYAICHPLPIEEFKSWLTARVA